VFEKTLQLKVRGFLPEDVSELQHLFERLTAVFGPASFTEELVIFFKYDRDMRLRLTKDRAQFILRTKIDPPRRDLQKVYIVPISLASTEAFVHQLFNLGYTEALFSLSKRYTYANARGSFRLKMNHVTGHFFDAAKKISGDDDVELARVDLLRILEAVGLTHMSDDEFFARSEECWRYIPKEPLVLPNGSLNSKISELLTRYAFSAVPPLQNESLKQLMRRASNDYSAAEDTFTAMANSNLVSKDPIRYVNAFLATASIIIPVRNSHATLSLTLDSIFCQELTRSQKRTLEIIVVDDGSSEPQVDAIYKECVRKAKKNGFVLKVIRAYENEGRSKARNLGLEVAQGDIVFFFDSDVLLERNYIRECMVRHQFVDKLVIVGFKQNISLSDASYLIGKKMRNAVPEIQRDFRFEKICEPHWMGLYPVKESCTVSCIYETNYFKDFGLGRTLGPFDLACMVVTHSMSASRNEVLAAGGFHSAFGKKWGLEDTYLGARLIARGNFVIPLLSSGVYHINTSANEDVKIKSRKYMELADNYSHYLKLLNLPYSVSGRHT
jgi:glycosyltransferase involved in cell wall biosynthesis